jgi:protease I
MSEELRGLSVAVLVANEGVEEKELTEPRRAVEDAGGRVEVIAPKPGAVQMFRHLDRSSTVAVDRTTTEASPGDYDALLLPGGVANADEIRTDHAAVHLVRELVEAGKPVAVICHGPWILIEAGVLHGCTLTSWPSLKTDLTNAGAQWVDEEVRVDGAMVSSRKPDDLPAFCREMVALFARASTRA